MNDHTQDRIDDELLQDWVDGFLDHEEARTVAERVAANPDLQNRALALAKEGELIASTLAWTAEHRNPHEAKTLALAVPPTWRRRPAYIVLGLAACLALVALPVWMVGGFKNEKAGSDDMVAVFAPLRDGPAIQLESVEAAPGETVYVTLRARNLKGFCGLQARVRVENGLEAMSTRSSGFTYAGVRGGEVFVASISEDGWTSEDGVILRLPVKVGSSAGGELSLELDDLRLVDSDRRVLDVAKQSARIRVL
ncbi:MAG: hypothetical protein KC964_16800 [Candidatus Omnitrophica bacterium]|nr:hypothetical protein [Candidatus Omnitrophota bacterium]